MSVLVYCRHCDAFTKGVRKPSVYFKGCYAVYCKRCAQVVIPSRSDG